MRWRTGSAIFVLALSACGQSPQQERAGEPATDALEAAPGVNVTAAPGVAFNYRYAFSLPSTQIAGAQEIHAAACEALGIARCRITAMRYQLQGEDRVEAMLGFKLDPALARNFGKQGIAAIQKAEGTLVDAEITGTDAGAEITRLSADRARAQAEVARIDRELARTNLPASERAELQRQRAEIAGRSDAAQTDTTAQRESLANTPMTFDYRSGRAIREFDAAAPLTSSLDLLSASLQATLAFVFGTLALLGPPALLAGLGFLLWRRFRSLRPRKPVAAPD